MVDEKILDRDLIEFEFGFHGEFPFATARNNFFRKTACRSVLDRFTNSRLLPSLFDLFPGGAKETRDYSDLAGSVAGGVVASVAGVSEGVSAGVSVAGAVSG
jgi:hypothetical protein